MKIIAQFFTAALVGAALVMPQPADAQKRRPNPKKPIEISKPSNVREASRKDKTHTSRKQMVASAKAALKRGKSTLKTARRDLKAVTRSEARNRALRLEAKGRWDQAKLAYESNPSPANAQAFNTADSAYRPIRQQHLASRDALFAQRARVEQLEGFQKQAMNVVRQGQGLGPRPPRTGQPRFANRGAPVERPISAYDRAPAPQQIYGPGPVSRVSNNAVSVQGAGAFAQTASQSLVRQFNQQQAQREAMAANGQFRAGANNNIYNRGPVVQNAYAQASDTMYF